MTEDPGLRGGPAAHPQPQTPPPSGAQTLKASAGHQSKRGSKQVLCLRYFGRPHSRALNRPAPSFALPPLLVWVLKSELHPHYTLRKHRGSFHITQSLFCSGASTAPGRGCSTACGYTSYNSCSAQYQYGRLPAWHSTCQIQPLDRPFGVFRGKFVSFWGQHSTWKSISEHVEAPLYTLLRRKTHDCQPLAPE